jgi:hypothetical protein
MQGLVTNPIFVGAAAALLSVICTYIVRAFALRRGYIAKPKSDRWHKRPTAMLGGVAIFVATAIAYLLFVPRTDASLVVMGASSFLFLVGLVDDLFSIRPYQKLIGQLIGADPKLPTEAGVLRDGGLRVQRAADPKRAPDPAGEAQKKRRTIRGSSPRAEHRELKPTAATPRESPPAEEEFPLNLL